MADWMPDVYQVDSRRRPFEHWGESDIRVSIVLQGVGMLRGEESLINVPMLELANTAIGQIDFGPMGSISNSEYLVDFQLTRIHAVPEPAGMALLACGGLAIAVSRRQYER
jgi:hypothetical protein